MQQQQQRNESIYEKLGIGVIGAGAALIGRDILERLRDSQKRQDELTALVDVYLGEIVAGADKCAQFVRQVCMNQVSRSKLPILIGPSKIDRVASLGAPPELHGALHAVYRLFDQVAHQISKGTADDFGAILAFVQGEFDSFTKGYGSLSGYARTLHDDATFRFGRRQLGKAVWALFRSRPVFLSLDEIKALDARFEKAKTECEAWFAAHKDALKILNAGKTSIDPKSGATAVSFDGKEMDEPNGKPPRIKAKTVRILVGIIEIHTQLMISGKEWGLPIPQNLAINATLELAGISNPLQALNEFERASKLREECSKVWRSLDPQPYD